MLDVYEKTEFSTNVLVRVKPMRSQMEGCEPLTYFNLKKINNVGKSEKKIKSIEHKRFRAMPKF